MVNIFNPDERAFNYMLEQTGKELTLNGSTQIKAILSSVPVNANGYDDKYLSTLSPIKQGDMVDYLLSQWIVISQINGMRTVKYKGIMRKCNNTMIVNVSGILHVVPIIVTDKVALNVDVSTYITTLDNQIYIVVQNDAINSNIKINDIYKIGNLNYKVVNIDDISISGLLYIKMDFSAEQQILPNYSVEILNGESFTTNVGTPVQLNIQQKDGDVILTEPLPAIFTSSDEAIATVDSLGMVDPMSLGSCVITVALASDLAVNNSISITVEEIPLVETYVLTLTGSSQPDTEIISGYTKTYTCVKKNSQGVVVEGALFDFTVIPGTTPVDKYTLTILSDTQCSIKANAATYYIDLWATDRSDNTLTISKHIKLKSLF